MGMGWIIRVGGVGEVDGGVGGRGDWVEGGGRLGMGE